MKFATEEAINVHLHDFQQCQQDELDKIDFTEAFEEPCTIYFITKRPKITIDPDFFVFKNRTIKLKFRRHREYAFEEHIIEIKISEDYNLGEKLRLKTSFPFREFEVLDEQGSVVHGKSTYILEQFKDQLDDVSFLDFEILYVGQSVDNFEIAPTAKRVKSHETLQKIYSKIISDHPDEEVFLILCSFKYSNFIEISSRIIHDDEGEKKEEERFVQKLKNPAVFTLAERTTFTEAALIRYFQPKYNRQFKNNFPDKRHVSYEQCYKSGINAVMFEIDLSDDKVFFFSESITRSSRHQKSYHLYSDEERRKMFDY